MRESTDIKTRLKQLRQGWPWQLLMSGDGISQITAEDADAHLRPVPACWRPGCDHIGRSPTGVTRFSERRVDQLLAGIFERNPAVTGITFSAACQRGEITADEMARRLKDIARQGAP